MTDCIAIFFSVAGLCVLLGACGLLDKLDPNRPCQVTAAAALELTELNARHTAELVRVCKAEGAKSVATCKGAPAVDAKYRAERAAWEQCK